MNIKNINRIYNVIEASVFTTQGQLDHDRLQDAFIVLCNLINAGDYDETLWYIGEFKCATLDSLLVGAYWHFTEWHEGQDSKSYAVLCAIGSIYQPNCASLDQDNYGEFETYTQLNAMAEA